MGSIPVRVTKHIARKPPKIKGLRVFFFYQISVCPLLVLYFDFSYLFVSFQTAFTLPRFDMSILSFEAEKSITSLIASLAIALAF